MKKVYSISLLPTILFFLLSFHSNAQVVINEVYGGGGNAGAVYKNDFIELYNNGSTAVSLVGWTVQYNSAGGTGNWQKTDLTGEITAHGYYLVQEALGGGGTTDLPAANVRGTINMSGTAGKVALVNNATLLTGANPVTAAIIDKVAFGTVTGGGFEGLGPAPAPGNTTSIQRTPEGTDSNDNAADFKTGAPSPVSSVVAANTITVTAGNSAAEPASNGSFVLNFSAATTASTAIDFAFTGGATFGTDYSVSYSTGSASSSAAGTLTVPAGTSSVSVTIVPTEDNLVEGAESVTLTLSNPTGGYTIATAAAVINIADNDVLPTVSVTAGTAAAEPATNGTFTIALSTPAPAGGVTVNYSLSGTATANQDFTDANAGSVTIAEGAVSATVTITVTDDAMAEEVETIVLTINSVSGGYTTSNAVATINLADNEVAPISLAGIYTQNFNSLASSGTANSLNLRGWSILETGGSARDNELYAADNGGSNTGDTYSYGTTATTDRSLGSVQSGTLVPIYGASFINSTGKTISSLKIDYTGEEWRLGAADRADRLDFQYSVNATDLTTGSWSDVDQLDFSTPTTTGTGAKDGNDAANRTNLSYTITGLSIAAGATFYIRWSDFNASGADDGLAIDNLSVEANPTDLTPPAIIAVSPVNAATNTSTNLAASINFNETIQKGSGSIVVKKTTDNSVVRTIDVTGAGVTVAITSASFNLAGLEPNTAYSIVADAATFTDLAGNPSVATTWSFTTGTLFYAADFNTCSPAITDGFTQFSSTGDQVWGCTPFGRDPLAPAGTAPAPYGVQVNGFANGTNLPNIDWLISPSFDLTGTTYPLLSFYSRTAFNGLPLQLKVSTDYVGGDPANATWTDINGKFPQQTSNTWTLSSGINLEAFKQANVHFAFVYTSTPDDGARWTLDDISIDNSSTPPPPSLTVSTADIRFAYVAGGSSADKTITFTGNDLTDNVALQSAGNFLLSKDGSSFSSSLVYTPAEANNLPTQVYVRFAPAQNGQDFTGSLTVNTSDLSSAVSLSGSSIDPATTLEVVNWNVEWFGSNANGPSNNDQQEQNVKKIITNTGADIYGLVEVVDETRLARIVASMPGYTYKISDFGSHTSSAENVSGAAAALAEAQKLAFVYKTSVFSNVTTEPLLSAGINSAADLSNPAYNYWSSGRYPYMMTADVTLNCVTKKVRFVLVHAKANTSPTATAYDRRKRGADTLYQVLQTLYPADNIMILGDFNDDFDRSITDGFTTPSWITFKNDAANYDILTLPLSLAGKKSTVSYNDMIDQVVVSNEMKPYYMASTATVLSDVTSLVSNYGSTTTDHYPVFTRYRFENPATPPTVLVCPTVAPSCVNSAGTYTIPAFTARAFCGDIKYSYLVRGATERSGNTNDASGTFNIGTSTINWTATDDFGNTAGCQTTVIINGNPVVSIPDVNALPLGVVANTVYIGYSPAARLTLTPVVTGGAPSYTYNWSNGTTGASAIVNPVVKTAYTVTVTDANSCQAATTKTIDVRDVRAGKKLDKVAVCHKAVSVEIGSAEVAEHLAHGDLLGECVGTPPSYSAREAIADVIRFLSSIVVYPNPTTRYFILSCNTKIANGKINIRVTDLFGRVIEKKENLDGIQNLQLGANYPRGVYFVEVSQESQRVVLPVVKL
jgi:hypothetical protein